MTILEQARKCHRPKLPWLHPCNIRFWWWLLTLPNDGEFMLSNENNEYACWCSTTGSSKWRDFENAIRYDGVMNKYELMKFSAEERKLRVLRIR